MNFQGLLVMMTVLCLLSFSSSLPIIPSGLALVTAPIVCPLFYVGKAVRTAQAGVQNNEKLIYIKKKYHIT